MKRVVRVWSSGPCASPFSLSLSAPRAEADKLKLELLTRRHFAAREHKEHKGEGFPLCVPCVLLRPNSRGLLFFPGFLESLATVQAVKAVTWKNRTRKRLMMNAVKPSPSKSNPFLFWLDWQANESQRQKLPGGGQTPMVQMGRLTAAYSRLRPSAENLFFHGRPGGRSRRGFSASQESAVLLGSGA